MTHKQASPTLHPDRTGKTVPILTGNTQGSVGQVELKFVTFDGSEHVLHVEGGGSLSPLTVAYETYGELSPERENAILVFHALTASQHAAGHTPDVPGLNVEWDK